MRRAALIFLLWLIAAGVALGQGSSYNDYAFRGAGQYIGPLPNATVTVCPLGSGGTPCNSPSVALYSDVALTHSISNPTNADGNGNINFFAAPGTYIVSVSAVGSQARNITVTLACPTNGSCTWTQTQTFAVPIVSTASTGTAPLSIASTTVVPNLNAQLHNGKTAPAGNIVGDSDTQTLTNKTLTAPTITNPSTTGADSGAETLTNKTFDISANTLKTSTNTAGHYPRNNGTQYVDATIAGADIPATTSNCSGVQFAQGLNAGHTPICATPPTFGASGSSHSVGYVPDPGSTAGTTHFLREDATWATVPAAGVSESVWTSGLTTLSGNTGNCISGGSAGQCITAIFPKAHTITRFTFTLATAPSGCSTNATFGIKDLTTSTVLTSITPTSGTFEDSGALSIATTAGDQLGMGIATASSGCTTQAVVYSLAMVYQ